MLRKRALYRHAVSVCLYVCLSRSLILSKRVIVSSNFFHHRVIKIFYFFRTKRHGNIPTGASNAGGVGTNSDSGRIAGCRSMTTAERDQQLTVFRAVVYSSYGARLFTAQIATHQ